MTVIFIYVGTNKGNMGFLRKKKVKKYQYYYYVEKERCNGKPVDSVHIYLGTADEILKKINARSESKSTITLKTFEFGKIATLLAIDEDLGFRQTVNDAVSKRNQNALTPGDWTFISIFGRWCGPLSKSATAVHFSESFLGFGSKFPSKLNAQNLISHMDYLDKETIDKIEMKLVKKLKEKGLVPNMVVWDTTNHYTFIEKGDNIPQKGKSKQGRHNKNLIGLGLGVSNDNIPIFHTTVPGNSSDVPLFNEAINDIISRLKSLDIAPEGLVLVFDKGNNSDENIRNLSGRIKVLGSLKKNQAKHLLEVPLSDYEYLYTTEKDVEISGYTTTLEIYGKEFSVVISFNPDTKKKQLRTYQRSKNKILKELEAVHKSMKRTGRGRPMTYKGAIKKAAKAVYPQYESIFKYDVVENDGVRVFKYWIDDKIEAQFIENCGKLIVFTDQDGWPAEKIVKTYNRKVFIENDFHWLKDKLLIPLTPVWHRNDEHIRAHVFICVMGLLFVRYLSYKLRILKLTDERILKELSNIRVGLVAKDDLKEPTIVVEDMTPVQARIFSLLDLGRYLKL